MKDSILASEKAKKFEALLIKLDALISNGFFLCETKQVAGRPATGKSYEYHFSSNNGVSIEFTYYPAFEDNSDYVLVYIIDDKSGKDFSLDSWLQSQGIKDQSSPFNLSSYTGEFNEQALEFLKFISELFVKKELKRVLDGRAWVDVNFTWGDVK